MTRWFLAGLLYADGMMAKEIALVMGISLITVKKFVGEAKGAFLGIAYSHEGHHFGVGTKLELRAAYVEAGWLTEPQLVT